MLDLAPHNPYGLRLSSPVLAAAGCFGYGVEYARSVDMRAIGAIVTRSTSLQGRRGRPLVLETPAGLLLAGTWPNPGLAHVLDRYAPTWAGWSTPVILSIIGANADEYGAIAAALEGAEGIAGIELNLAAHAEQSARIVAAARKATQLPLLAKLPHSPDIVALGQAAADAGADALVLFAPFGGSAANPRTGELLGGGLVGPATRPLVLAALAGAAAHLSLPIIACGGAGGADDVRRLLAAGATAVALGSALLANPHLAGRIGAELAEASK